MEHICGECKYCEVRWDKQGWEVTSCYNENGRGTNDECQEACEQFEERED